VPRTKRPAAPRRSVDYRIRLAAVRQLVEGFDAKKWTDLYEKKPRTPATKKARARDLARLRRKYAQLKPFLQRSYKIIRPRKPEHVAAIAEYANVPKVKGLRAVPVATEFPDKFKVRVDRKGQVIATRGKRYKEVLYKFPKRPRAHTVKAGRAKKFVTAGEDAIAQMQALLPKLKPGIYVLMTRSQVLVPFTADRDSLLQTLREFVFRYEKNAADFMRELVGVKWLAHSAQAAMKRQKEIKAGRTEAQRRRQDAKRMMAERTAKKLGRISKRARATGRQ
jgi:hypothetical protein